MKCSPFLLALVLGVAKGGPIPLLPDTKFEIGMLDSPLSAPGKVSDGRLWMTGHDDARWGAKQPARTSVGGTKRDSGEIQPPKGITESNVRAPKLTESLDSIPQGRSEDKGDRSTDHGSSRIVSAGIAEERFQRPSSPSSFKTLSLAGSDIGGKGSSRNIDALDLAIPESHPSQQRSKSARDLQGATSIGRPTSQRTDTLNRANSGSSLQKLPTAPDNNYRTSISDIAGGTRGQGGRSALGPGAEGIGAGMNKKIPTKVDKTLGDRAGKTTFPPGSAITPDGLMESPSSASQPRGSQLATSTSLRSHGSPTDRNDSHSIGDTNRAPKSNHIIEKGDPATTMVPTQALGAFKSNTSLSSAPVGNRGASISSAISDAGSSLNSESTRPSGFTESRLDNAKARLEYSSTLDALDLAGFSNGATADKRNQLIGGSFSPQIFSSSSFEDVPSRRPNSTRTTNVRHDPDQPTGSVTPESSRGIANTQTLNLKPGSAQNHRTSLDPPGGSGRLGDPPASETLSRIRINEAHKGTRVDTKSSGGANGNRHSTSPERSPPGASPLSLSLASTMKSSRSTDYQTNKDTSTFESLESSDGGLTPLGAPREIIDMPSKIMNKDTDSYSRSTAQPPGSTSVDHRTIAGTKGGAPTAPKNLNRDGMMTAGTPAHPPHTLAGDTLLGKPQSRSSLILGPNTSTVKGSQHGMERIADSGFDDAQEPKIPRQIEAPKTNFHKVGGTLDVSHEGTGSKSSGPGDSPSDRNHNKHREGSLRESNSHPRIGEKEIGSLDDEAIDNQDFSNLGSSSPRNARLNSSHFDGRAVREHEASRESDLRDVEESRPVESSFGSRTRGGAYEETDEENYDDSSSGGDTSSDSVSEEDVNGTGALSRVKKPPVRPRRREGVNGGSNVEPSTIPGSRTAIGMQKGPHKNPLSSAGKPSSRRHRGTSAGSNHQRNHQGGGEKEAPAPIHIHLNGGDGNGPKCGLWKSVLMFWQC